MKQTLSFGCIILYFLLAESITAATPVTQIPDDLTMLNIEELAEIEVTSVSRTPRKLSHSAAAIFVITQDDIRRSGATTIPEALRMVPGLHVARISSEKWAVTSRGFNSRYANKLLVQLDGRTLYSPLFSGVFWESQDIFLDDVDRIEIIRGPGASLWGANAVNGIINIITRHSSQTTGALVFGGGGSNPTTLAGARYGDSINSDASYRLFTQYAARADSQLEDGTDAGDDWTSGRAGFRTDIPVFPDSELTFQGDFYQGSINEVSDLPTLTPPYSLHYVNENDMSGHYLLGRFTRSFSATSDMAVQLFYDRTQKEESATKWTGDIFDVDVQHRFTPIENHELIWGFGYRFYTDDIDYSIGFRFDSDSEENHLFSAFLQDSISLSQSVTLTLGAKIEHNDYTNIEFQPNSRISWSPNKSHHLWAALSRAVRTPNRADTSIRFVSAIIPPGTPENPGPLPAAVTIAGNDSVVSEELTALETGYRFLMWENLSVDTTAFYYWYSNRSSYAPGTPYTVPDGDPPHLVIPLDVNNMLDGNTWGFEVASNWQPFPKLRLQTAYTFFGMDLTSNSLSPTESDDEAPNHQVSLRTSVDLPYQTELDIWLRYVDDVLAGTVDSYTEADVRIGWRPTDWIELSVTGQNLLNNRHPEFIEPFIWSEPTETPRTVYGKITLNL